MGLGKSLSMISLIAANQYLGIGHHIEAGMTPTKSTLLVVPLPRMEFLKSENMEKLTKLSLTNLGDTTLKVSSARKRFLGRIRLLLQRAYQSLGAVEVPLILFAFRLLKHFG